MNLDDIPPFPPGRIELDNRKPLSSRASIYREISNRFRCIAEGLQNVQVQMGDTFIAADLESQQNVYVAEMMYYLDRAEKTEKLESRNN